MKKKNVMIFAYTNFNLGDDLFVKILCERYPNSNFLIYAPKKYKYTFSNIKNIKVIPSNRFAFKLLNQILKLFRANLTVRELISRKSDVIVHIGGSIFIERENWKKAIKRRKNRTNLPYFVLGSNFGPYKEEGFFKAYYELFKTFTDVCFRDSYSYELFKKLDNVRKADDVVFQLKVPSKNTMSSKKNLLISVIKPSFRKEFISYDLKYYQKIKEIILMFTKKGYEVTLMSFCKNEGDEEAIKEIIDLLPIQLIEDSAVHTYYYEGNIEESLKKISQSSYIIGTRFHSMILGWVYNKPVYPICYSEKMNNVLNDIDYKGSYLNLIDIEELDLKIVDAGQENNKVKISAQIKNSELQFEKLDQYIS